MWDPTVVVAIVGGVVAIVSAALGFRSKREEAATTGLSDLIKGLQAQLTRQDGQITRLEAAQARLEEAVEERDSEIHTLKLAVESRDRALEAKDSEIERLIQENALFRARVVELEVAHGAQKLVHVAGSWDEGVGGE